jgi:hypothetical protein
VSDDNFDREAVRQRLIERRKAEGKDEHEGFGTGGVGGFTLWFPAPQKAEEEGEQP